MRAREVHRVLSALCFIVAIGAPTPAAADPWSAWLASALTLDLPVGYATSAIRSGVTVKFARNGGGAAALYQPLTHRITFDLSLADGAGRLRPLTGPGALSPVDAGIVYHELWHAYFARRLAAENPSLLAFFRGGFAAYASAPAGKREEIQDEAYGIAIQGVLGGFLQLRRDYRGMDPQDRASFRASAALRKIWGDIPRYPYFGYYSGRWPARGIVPARERLPQAHVQRILDGPLEGRFPAEFDREFF